MAVGVVVVAHIAGEKEGLKLSRHNENNNNGGGGGGNNNNDRQRG